MLKQGCSVMMGKKEGAFSYKTEKDSRCESRKDPGIVANLRLANRISNFLCAYRPYDPETSNAVIASKRVESNKPSRCMANKGYRG